MEKESTKHYRAVMTFLMIMPSRSYDRILWEIYCFHASKKNIKKKIRQIKAGVYTQELVHSKNWVQIYIENTEWVTQKTWSS